MYFFFHLFGFRLPLEQILQQTEEASEMLYKWRSCYMETRARIEASGKGQRWEFDKNKLFANSDYIAKVCGDLHKVSMVSYYAHKYVFWLA